MTLTYADAIHVIKEEIADLTNNPERLASDEARGILAGLRRALYALTAVHNELA